MTVRDFVRLVQRRWLTIGLGTLLGVAVAVAMVLTTPRTYTADAQLFVGVGSSDNASQLAQGNAFAQARVQSYKNLVTNPDVLQPVIDDLGLHETTDDLAASISADAPLNRVLINVHASDRSPQQAARILNAVAERFVDYVLGLEGQDSGVRLTISSRASVPHVPSSPRTKLDLVIGLIVGLIAGLALALLRNALDTKIRDRTNLADIGATMLAAIPLDKAADRVPIAFRGDPHGARAEAFRRLRTNLEYVDVDNPPHVIAVTSAVPGEGKTTTALNVAASLAEAGQKVVLLEADLRRPTVAGRLGVLPDIGVTTALTRHASALSVVQTAGRGLFVLTSGEIPPNPSELLSTERAQRIIHELRSEFDYVVVDCPPVVPVADAAQLSKLVEATLLVVRAGQTTKGQYELALAALERVGTKPAGVILNGERATGSRQYYTYYQSYRPATDVSKVSESAGETEPATLEPAGR